jgi:hypothetical protein
MYLHIIPNMALFQNAAKAGNGRCDGLMWISNQGRTNRRPRMRGRLLNPGIKKDPNHLNEKPCRPKRTGSWSLYRILSAVLLTKLVPHFIFHPLIAIFLSVIKEIEYSESHTPANPLRTHPIFLTFFWRRGMHSGQRSVGNEWALSRLRFDKELSTAGE